MAPVTVSNQPTHPTCCHGVNRPPSLSEKVLRGLEKVSLVALAAFAAVSDVFLFTYSFTAGMAIGLLWDGATQTQCDEQHKGCGTCSNGFLEHLTKVKLPLGIGVVANVAILAAHIDHHATVFVPLVGVTTGIYVGATLRPPLCSLGHKIVAIVRKPVDNYIERLGSALIHLP